MRGRSPPRIEADVTEAIRLEQLRIAGQVLRTGTCNFSWRLLPMARFSYPNRPLILLVEDEPMVRDLSLDILQEAGFRIVEAGNADEAFDILKRRRDVELVLTDIDMPGSLDGLEFARLVAQGWPDVRLLVVSGKVRPGPGQLPIGSVFLAKPYRPEMLVAELVRLARNEHENDTTA